MEYSSSTVTVTDDSFAEDVLSASGIVLVDFWASWCVACKTVAPILEEIAGERSGELTVATLDVDTNPVTPRDLNVRSVPTMIVFRAGQAVKRIVGARDRKALLQDLADVL